MKEFPVLDTHKGKGKTWPEEKTFWMKEQDESRMTLLPPKGGEVMGDSGIGSMSPPLSFIDGGGPVRTRERKASHPPGGGEALGSQEEERKKDKEVRKGKPADSEKARPSSKRANLQSEKVKPRVVSDIMIVAPTSMSKESQRIITEAEKKIIQMQEEIKSLLEVVKSARQKELSTRNTGFATGLPDKTPQTKGQQQPKAESCR